MAVLTPDKIQSNKYKQYFDQYRSGSLYDTVVSTGQRFLDPYFNDLSQEMNKRLYQVKRKRSYSPIAEYFTIPMGQPYLTQHPVDPYGVPAVSPVLPNAHTTPELLLEPYLDDMVFSYHTVADMLDMYSKKLPFDIINDKDVVNIYFRIKLYLETMRDIGIPLDHTTVKMLKKLQDMHIDMEIIFKKVCNKNNWKFYHDTFLQIFDITAMK